MSSPEKPLPSQGSNEAHHATPRALLHETWELRDASPTVAMQMIDSLEIPVDDPHLSAQASVVRAFLLYRRGELQQALPLVLGAIETLASAPLDFWGGRASNTAALVYSGLGLPEAAVDHLLIGQKQSESVDDRQTAFSCFHNLGVEQTQIGDYEGALDNYDRAEIFADYGFQGHAFLALNRCDLYLDKGEIEMALKTVELGKKHWQGSDTQAGLFGLLVEARVALAADDSATADRALRQLRANFDPSRAGAELLMLEARVLLQQGQLNEASDFLAEHELGPGTTSVEDIYLAARLARIHIEIAENRGDYRQAFAIVQSAWDTEIHVRRQAMSRVTTLILRENSRQLEKKSRELETQNLRLNEALEELRGLHSHVNELALRDHLTGLHNRRYMAEHVGEFVEQHQRYGRDLSLLVVDVDDFKSINDTYLHATGDKVLQTIASLLQSQTRSADVLCRLGGDEFVALLPETDIASARHMANRLHAAVRNHSWETIAENLNVSVSIGSATAGAADSFEQLLVAADRAMYHAKSAGKNQVKTSPGPDGS